MTAVLYPEREVPSQASVLEARKNTAHAWFSNLRDQVCELYEELEEHAPGPFPVKGAQPGRFSLTPWTVQNLDRPTSNEAHSRLDPNCGGVQGILRGRIFEKMAVHVSAVYGTFSETFKNTVLKIDGAGPSEFWASGISLIAHPWNPHVPTLHMNTRFLVTPQKAWFGGGADLTPMLDSRRTQEDPDTELFHSALKYACESHCSVANYTQFKTQCDDYFFLPHRQEHRGIGGIFYDHLWSENFDADMAFTQAVGQTTMAAYAQIVRSNFTKPWTAEERREQGIRRGRYVEFNLLYDRGTLFGLKLGGNIDSILSSMPPYVLWP
jgi:coproporphyrinogen III oxidase